MHFVTDFGTASPKAARFCRGDGTDFSVSLAIIRGCIVLEYLKSCRVSGQRNPAQWATGARLRRVIAYSRVRRRIVQVSRIGPVHEGGAMNALVQKLIADLNGPMFLLFYALVIGAVVTACYQSVRSVDVTRKRRAPQIPAQTGSL